MSYFYLEGKLIAILGLIAAIVGPIVAVIASNWYTNSRIKEQQKLMRKERVLQMLMESRFITARPDMVASNQDFFRALNAIPVVFGKHDKIIKVYKKYYDNKTQELLIDLIHEVAKELVQDTNLDADMIEKVFLPTKFPNN